MNRTMSMEMTIPTSNFRVGDTFRFSAGEKNLAIDITKIKGPSTIEGELWPWHRYYTRPIKAFFIRNWCRVFGPIYNKWSG